MGRNEKDQRQNTVVEITTKNGVFDAIRFYTPISGSKIDYTGYLMDTDGNYVHEQKELDISPKGSPKIRPGFPKPGITPATVTNEITDFILQNNDKYRFEIKIDGKGVNYETFCKGLVKSQAIMEMKGVAVYYESHPGRKPTDPAMVCKSSKDDLEFALSGTKAIIQELKKLTNDGTKGITQDMVETLQKIPDTKEHISVTSYRNSGRNGIQIVQDLDFTHSENKKGPNAACYDIYLPELPGINIGDLKSPVTPVTTQTGNSKKTL